ncbi:MAG TPA: sialidase family protein [Terriglobales bacterium]|nr:sialidase family protein [Terriglobales bacterium]
MRFLRVIFTCLLLVALCFAQKAPEEKTSELQNGNGLPLAPGAQVTTLTKPGYFTEPAVAINPKNPDQVVVAFQDNVHAAYSGDAGKTWKVVGAEPKNYKVSGDVSTVFDNRGYAYICYIAFDKLGTFSYWAHGATRNGIYVRRSLDGGKTWEANDFAVAQQPSDPGIPFEDKPEIVADTTAGAHAGTLYVGWTRWTLDASPLVISHSTDAGKSWSAPVQVNSEPGLPRDDNGANEGFSGTVTPDGTLYAIWSDGSHIVLTSSSDGGVSFTKARSVIDTAPSMYAVQGFSRGNGFPQIASGSDGALYVAWSDYRNGDIDVFLSKSVDNGQTWRAPVRVNNDPLHDGDDQFYQWLSVDPKDASVNLMFYDRRGDEHNSNTRVTIARSTDGGITFKNYALSTDPFVAHDEFMGDYSGVAAFNGRVYATWTETGPLPKGKRKRNKNGRERPHTIVRVGSADFAGR